MCKEGINEVAHHSYFSLSKRPPASTAPQSPTAAAIGAGGFSQPQISQTSWWHLWASPTDCSSWEQNAEEGQCQHFTPTVHRNKSAAMCRKRPWQTGCWWNWKWTQVDAQKPSPPRSADGELLCHHYCFFLPPAIQPHSYAAHQDLHRHGEILAIHNAYTCIYIPQRQKPLFLLYPQATEHHLLKKLKNSTAQAKSYICRWLLLPRLKNWCILTRDFFANTLMPYNCSLGNVTQDTFFLLLVEIIPPQTTDVHLWHESN